MFPRWLPVLVLGAAAALPALAAEPVAVTMGAVTVLEIGGDIRTVVVAKPEIADASVTGPRRLFLLGRKTGRTGLLVIGIDGAPLLETSVTVAPSNDGMVTVNRGVKESTLSCTPRCADADPGKNAQETASTPAPAAAAPSVQAGH